MRARRCGNCGDELGPEDAGTDMERGEAIERWCRDCVAEEAERQADLDRERDLGVYGEGEEPTNRYITEERADGWYWLLEDPDGQVLREASEAYAGEGAAEIGAARDQLAP